jgi:hypothetical protein
MKIKKLVILTAMLSFPLFSMAQKAFENVAYRGKLNSRTVSFNLANGYIGASEISIRAAKTLRYTPEAGYVDRDGKMKFSLLTTSEKPASDYFVLEGMAETYEHLPATIKGIYYDKRKQLKVVFYKLR